MKRKLLLILSILMVASGLFLLSLIIFSFRNVEKGALQVTTNIKSKVFLDGKQVGETQLCLCDQNKTIPIGNYEVRVEPTDTTYPSYTTRVKINGGVLTAVDRTFLPGSLASSYVLTLEKSTSPKAELIITTIPDGAMITIDSNPVGATPYKTDTLSASEHEIEIQKQGFAKKTIRVKTINEHLLSIKSQLGTDGGDIQTENTPLPTPSITLTPTPESNASKVTILKTPNGFLRVRSGAGTTFPEVGRVKPGDTFDILEEENGWYKITLEDGNDGWISSQYAEKN